MENKYNIEELQYLIPDLITGQISDDDKQKLERAMEESSELRALYNELKGTIGIVETIQSVEPPPAYWNNLLPRIHKRIEEKEAASFSWDKVASYWKILVPIAAVILIAVVYYLAVPSKTELTEKEKIEKTIKDSNKQNDRNEIKEDPKRNDKLPVITDDDKKTYDTEHKNEFEQKKIKRKTDNKSNYIVKEDVNTNNEEEKKQQVPDNENDQFTEAQLEADLEDTSLFSEGVAGGIGEDVENELSNLNEHEKNSLLHELENSNL